MSVRRRENFTKPSCENSEDYFSFNRQLTTFRHFSVLRFHRERGKRTTTFRRARLGKSLIPASIAALNSRPR